MLLRVLKSMMFLAACFLSAAGAAAQSQAPRATVPDRQESKEEMPKNFREMLTKLKVEREKQDHDEMLKRGEEAAVLTQQLENAFQENNSLGPKDRQKLESLEKIVVKIRRELGGDDDEEAEPVEAAKDKWPTNLQEAFNSLKTATLSLVEELKKTSRFTISAIAIQSSNSVLKLVKFLRLRK